MIFLPTLLHSIFYFQQKKGILVFVNKKFKPEKNTNTFCLYTTKHNNNYLMNIRPLKIL